MKKIIILCLLSAVISCAGVDPFEAMEIQTGAIYRFTNPTLHSSLYLKFLPRNGENSELLFKTANNAERVHSLEFGAPGVLQQKIYSVSERGKISFQFFEEGLFDELIRYHQYASSGGQQDNIAMFRYRLDFRRAVKIH